MGDAWYNEGGSTGLAQAEIEYKDFITFFPDMPEAAEAQLIRPILIGPAKPAHILTPSVTARGIVNLTAIAVVEAQAAQEEQAALA